MEFLNKRVRINLPDGCFYHGVCGTVVGIAQEDPPLYIVQTDYLDPRAPFHTIYKPSELEVVDPAE